MLLEKFSSYLRHERRFSPHTLLSYQNDLKQFSDFLLLSELDFVSARHAHVRSWIVQLMEDQCQAKSISRKLSALRSFYKFLIREGLIDNNPALQVKAPKIPRKLPVVIDELKLNQLLDSQEFQQDFDGLRDKLIIELFFGTGIRLSELITLNEADTDLSNFTIKVLGKRNKERIIPINAALRDHILLYVNEKKKQQFHNNSLKLIVTSSGQSAYPKFIYRTVKRCLEKISSQGKRSPHVLRHTFATSLLNNGADINAIKELLGHSSLAATQVYTHNSVERLKSVYKQAHPKA